MLAVWPSCHKVSWWCHFHLHASNLTPSPSKDKRRAGRMYILTVQPLLQTRFTDTRDKKTERWGAKAKSALSPPSSDRSVSPATSITHSTGGDTWHHDQNRNRTGTFAAPSEVGGLCGTSSLLWTSTRNNRHPETMCSPSFSSHKEALWLCEKTSGWVLPSVEGTRSKTQADILSRSKQVKLKG